MMVHWKSEQFAYSCLVLRTETCKILLLLIQNQQTAGAELGCFTKKTFFQASGQKAKSSKCCQDASFQIQWNSVKIPKVHEMLEDEDWVSQFNVPPTPQSQSLQNQQTWLLDLLECSIRNFMYKCWMCNERWIFFYWGLSSSLLYLLSPSALQTTQPPKVLFPPGRQDTVIEVTPGMDPCQFLNTIVCVVFTSCTLQVEHMELLSFSHWQHDLHNDQVISLLCVDWETIRWRSSRRQVAPAVQSSAVAGYQSLIQKLQWSKTDKTDEVQDQEYRVVREKRHIDREHERAWPQRQSDEGREQG